MYLLSLNLIVFGKTKGLLKIKLYFIYTFFYQKVSNSNTVYNQLI